MFIRRSLGVVESDIFASAFSRFVVRDFSFSDVESSVFTRRLTSASAKLFLETLKVYVSSL